MAAPLDPPWRIEVRCSECGAPGVVVTVVADESDARCASCGRAHFGAPVPERPTPGANNGYRMGQGGALLPVRRDAIGPLLGPPALEAGPVVMVSTRERAAVPDAAMPANLPELRDAFGAAGWVWEIGYSLATIPAVRYVATARNGKAGQIRKVARDVQVVTLRVRRPWVRAYASWTDRRWSGGAAVSTGDGWRALGTAQAFRALIDG